MQKFRQPFPPSFSFPGQHRLDGVRRATRLVTHHGRHGHASYAEPQHGFSHL